MHFSVEHRFAAPPAAVASVLADPAFYRAVELPDLQLLEARPLEARPLDARPLDARPLDARPLGSEPDEPDDSDSPDGAAACSGAVDEADEPSVARGQGVALRYEFTGALDPAARRLLGGSSLTWAQEVRLRGEEGGSLSFAAEARPHLLHGRADFALVAPGGGTVRRLRGDLVVAVPIVGAMAERRIVAGVLVRLDVEAGALRRWLAARD